MIIYSVRIKIQQSVETEWYNWMKDTHIPAILDTGFFTDAVIYKEISDDKLAHMSSYEIHYKTDAIENFIKYSEGSADKFREEHSKLYGGKYMAERVLLMEV